MGEKLPGNGEKVLPRILEFITTPECPERHSFTIDKSAKGIDVLASIEFIDPTPERKAAYVTYLLKEGIEKRGLLDGKAINVPDPIGKVSENLGFIGQLFVTDKPLYDDVELALSHAYNLDEDALAEFKLGFGPV